MVNFREHILGKKDRKTRLVEIPEWDVTDENGVVVEKCIVMVKSISARLRARIIEENMDGQGKVTEVHLSSMYPELVAGSAYYPDDYADKELAGTKMFIDDDVPLLAEKDANAVEKIVIASLEVSGMTATAVDDEAKNSDKTPNGGLTLESPTMSDVP